MALDAGPFIRTGTRGSPSWPGSNPETGYVDADCSDRSAEAACRRGGPYVDGTLCGLAVDDRRRRARFAACVLPHLNIERVVDALQRPVPVPQVKVLPDGAARRQVLRQRLPLTPRPEHIKDRVEDLTNVHRSRAAAALCRTDQRSHQRPFGLRQITLVTQAAPVGGRSMFRLPHEAPPNQVPFKESQAIPATQVLSGTALRTTVAMTPAQAKQAFAKAGELAGSFSRLFRRAEEIVRPRGRCSI